MEKLEETYTSAVEQHIIIQTECQEYSIEHDKLRLQVKNATIAYNKAHEPYLRLQAELQQNTAELQQTINTSRGLENTTNQNNWNTARTDSIIRENELRKKNQDLQKQMTILSTQYFPSEQHVQQISHAYSELQEDLNTINPQEKLQKLLDESVLLSQNIKDLQPKLHEAVLLQKKREESYKYYNQQYENHLPDLDNTDDEMPTKTTNVPRNNNPAQNR